MTEYVPATQLVHALAPAAAHVPARHEVHVAADCADVDAELVPGGQSVQESAPAPAHWPAAHATHVEASVAPTADDAEPAVHGVQTEAVCAPAPAVEYEPAGQLVQVAEPASAYLPAVQVVHVEASVAPVAAEAVPAAQLRHAFALGLGA